MTENELIRETDTIYAIVTQHPELRDVLKSLSPRFAKLDNPVVFNTAARVATVKDAARTGKLYLRELLYELNGAIGRGDEYLEQERAKVAWIRDGISGPAPWLSSEEREKPEWADDIPESSVMDVRGDAEDPFVRITAAAEKRRPGEGFILIQKFPPFPLIRYLTDRGFSSWIMRAADDEFRVYFMKSKTGPEGDHR